MTKQTLSNLYRFSGFAGVASRELRYESPHGLPGMVNIDFYPSRFTTLQETRRVSKRSIDYPAMIQRMTKVHAAEREFADFIELVPHVGPHGRYVLRDSGFSISALYQFFVEGYSNEEIAAMLNGLTADDVAKVHAFIDALI